MIIIKIHVFQNKTKHSKKNKVMVVGMGLVGLKVWNICIAGRLDNGSAIIRIYFTQV